MEIIRKKISLEQSKIHLNGGLPYIPYNEEYTEILSCNTEPIKVVEWTHDSILEKEIYESNYGNFQCDITPESELFSAITTFTDSLVTTDDDGTEYIRSTNLIRRYNQLLTMLRNGLHLKHVKNESCEDTGDYTVTYLNKFTYNGVSGDTTYGFLREAVPVDMFDEDGEQQFKNMGNGTYLGPVVDEANYVIVLDNYEQFIALGGRDLIDIVDGILVDIYAGPSAPANTEEYVAPYISIPILLTSCEDSLGIMTPYQDENEFVFNGEVSYDVANKYNPDTSGGSLYDEDRIYDGVVEDNINLSWKLKPTEINQLSALTNDVLVESQLQTLRVPKYYVSDDNEILPGLFVENTNPFFICTYTEEDEIGKWTAVQTESAGLVCADGEDIHWDETGKYQTITVMNSLLKYDDVQPNKSYTFLIKYDNSEETPMTIPYVVGEVMNRGFDKITNSYTGDYIISIDESDDEISFEYMIGAKFTDNTYSTLSGDGYGVYYKETYPYEKSVSATTILDGVETIYWYNRINFDESTSIVYSEDLNLNRSAVISLADSLFVGDVWKDDGTVINTPLIKEEYLMSASMDAITNIDVSIDRGNATAFEKHLILGECNSYQDLLNYRNNIYNL